MKKIGELGALIKSKYPGQYEDLADERLGVMIKKKFPDSYNDYFDDDTYTKVAQLKAYYDPSRGQLSSMWQRLKAEGRNKLLTVLNKEEALVLEQAAMLENAVRDGRKKMIEFEMFLAQHHFQLFKMKAETTLIEQALQQGYTLENNQTVKLETHKHELKKDRREHKSYLKRVEQRDQTFNMMALQDNETKNQKKLARTLSKLKIHESREIGSIELNHRLMEKQEMVRLAIISKQMAGFQKRMLVQELLDQCYSQIEEIKCNPNLLEDTKQRMIDDREDIISFFKGQAGEFMMLE